MKRNKGILWAAFGLGIGYFIWLELTGLAIPCMFRKITGWLCPGCGITTLFLCLTRLDFAGACAANPFLFVTGPFLAAGLLYDALAKAHGKETPKWIEYSAVLYGIALCVFGVLRNI